MKPTYEELEVKLLGTLVKLVDTLNLLKLALEQILGLEERLSKNSNNSSKPPSTDHKENPSSSDKVPKRRPPRINRALLSSEQIDLNVKLLRSLRLKSNCEPKRTTYTSTIRATRSQG